MLRFLFFSDWSIYWVFCLFLVMGRHTIEKRVLPIKTHYKYGECVAITVRKLRTILTHNEELTSTLVTRLVRKINYEIIKQNIENCALYETLYSYITMISLTVFFILKMFYLILIIMVWQNVKNYVEIQTILIVASVNFFQILIKTICYMPISIDFQNTSFYFKPWFIVYSSTELELWAKKINIT